MTPADAALAALLFLGATLGHFALVLRSHNWWYGSGLGRAAIDVLQALHGLLLLAGPVAFWYAVGFDLRTLFTRPVDDLGLRFLAGYVSLCWLTGFVFVPAVTVARLRRRCPALVSEEKTTVFVEKLLGKPLHGDGKHSGLARLPFNQVREIDLTVKTLILPIPPEWDGLTILHVSDLHYCGTPAREYHERVLELCMDWKPDVVALTGDYVDSLAHHAWLEPLLGKLQGREAKLAILGNHDHWYEPETVRDKLREMGYRTPRNSWEAIEVRGRPMVLIGDERPWVKPAPAMTGCPEGIFRLCLSHTPDNIAWARANGADLMLSGHVHGGQIRLPVFGSLVVPSQYGRRYDSGTYQEGRTVLHVSRGVSGKHPLRWNCRPEVTLLVLRPQLAGETVMTAHEIIELLQLQPLPLEGGYYRETYRSPQRLSGGKSAGTAIYYLLTPDTCSVLHRLPTDEVYHFYLGDPVELLQLGAGGEIVTLGPDLLAGQRPQFIVAAGCWQGSALREGGAFALMGTTMAPGFDFSDYKAGDRAGLLAAYPAFADRIRRLTV